MILVSSCLAGVACRYDATSKTEEKIQSLVQQKKAMTICPEVLGGLSTPRPPAEIVGGSGEDVILGKATVVTCTGEDVTEQYVEGANRVLAIANKLQPSSIFLKENSPSCGSKAIYNGTFTGAKINGEGVTSALLRLNGFHVLSEGELERL